MPLVFLPGPSRPKLPGEGAPTPPTDSRSLPGLRFEDLPIEEQLALSPGSQNELKSRPPNRRGDGAKGAGGGNCTRYFKRTNASTGRTEWRVITGQPCGPDARPTPRPPPRPTPPPRPVPTPQRVCDRNDQIVAHIDGLLQSGAGVYGGLGTWKSQGLQIIRTELPICADIARDFNARILNLQSRTITPISGGTQDIAAAIQMYFAALAKTRRELWSDQWSLPI